MHGYDTIVLAWNETGRWHRDKLTEPDLWDTVAWQHDTTDAVNGSRRRVLNLPKLQFTSIFDERKQLDECRVQTSLPKLLFGDNISTLTHDDIKPALLKLDDAIHEHFPKAPCVLEMLPRRVDATDDRELGEEHYVSAALHRMASLSMRGKRPWVGQQQTISWPGSRGGYTSKAYSKLRETGDERARGKLRVERGALGQRAIKKALGLAEEHGHLTLGALVGHQDASQRILGPFTGIVDRVLLEVAQMTTLEALSKLTESGCTFLRASTLIGYACIIRACGGWDYIPLSRNNIYLAKKAFEKAGVDPMLVEISPKETRFLYQHNKRMAASWEKLAAAEGISVQQLDELGPIAMPAAAKAARKKV